MKIKVLLNNNDEIKRCTHWAYRKVRSTIAKTATKWCVNLNCKVAVLWFALYTLNPHSRFHNQLNNYVRADLSFILAYFLLNCDRGER